MQATDNHVGFLEKDPIRGNDTVRTFEEILQIGVRHQVLLCCKVKVDFVLLGGDLFHDNKPSRKTMHSVMELFRKYCLGNRPVEFQLLSDPAKNFVSKEANWRNQNLNISLPVLCIHGNHDDPTEESNLSAMDLLSSAGVVNYFGKVPEVDKIEIAPILLQKGNTRVALYGLGSIRDERLHRTFLSHQVKMLYPNNDEAGDWFNMLVFHQNRSAHGPTNHIPESFLDENLHLVIWGHEHECRIDPEFNSAKEFFVIQPGSSAITSLAEAESKPKYVGILTIEESEFELEKVMLTTVRPFKIASVSLEDYTDLKPSDQKKQSDILMKLVRGMIEEAKAEWMERNGKDAEFPLPLIRLKVEYSDTYSPINPQRFGQQFVKEIANPKDMLVFYRKKTESKPRAISDRPVVIGANDKVEKMEDLISKILSAQKLEILPENELSDSIRIFVEKDDRDSIEKFLTGTLENMRVSLEQSRSFVEEDLNHLISQVKKNREEDYQKKIFGHDALLTHKKTYEDEDKVSESSAEEDEKPVKKSSTARGRGRGRGSSKATTTVPRKRKQSTLAFEEIEPIDKQDSVVESDEAEDYTFTNLLSKKKK